MSVGVGVVGTGVMGSEHARVLRREVPGAHLAGVFDADPDRARAATAGAVVFSDPRSLIASERIEAVVIASPDATHAELTLACLEAGKPVLCEKPLASTAAEALRVVHAGGSRVEPQVDPGRLHAQVRSRLSGDQADQG
jgi:myo-inositol 2-dehydrogenase / D-chiro-inositol 1-dehydrogenase